MATRQEMEATYNYMDEIFRLSLGETGDLTCAMYNGDFSKTLAQAQKDKHDYVLNALNFRGGITPLARFFLAFDDRASTNSATRPL